MARQREFDVDKALESAKDLFWSRGYSATSMDDIVVATGVSRYGLYGTFGNKRDLFLAALRRYATSDLASTPALRNIYQEGAGLAVIHDWFEDRLKMTLRNDPQRGCMISNTATEVAPHDEKIAVEVRSMFDRLRSAFSCAVGNAQAAGEVRADLDREAMGTLLLGLSQGMCVAARSGHGKIALRQYVNAARAAVA